MREPDLLTLISQPGLATRLRLFRASAASATSMGFRSPARCGTSIECRARFLFHGLQASRQVFSRLRRGESLISL
jgi:hypothetical protein